MAWYSGEPVRAGRQVVADLLVAVWVLGWIVVARAVHAAVSTLATPMLVLERSAGGVSGGLRNAGDQAARVPFVGEDLAAALDRAAGSMVELASSGAGYAEDVARLALLLSLFALVVPVVSVLVAWLPVRLRFVAAAARARRLAASPAGLTILALSALTTQPPGRLLQVAPDPAAAWRDGDPAVVARLADLQLRAHGLPPTGLLDR